MQLYVLNGIQRPSFYNSTLILPIVSTGNVAQLAVDLIIATCGLELIGSLDSRDLVPTVGPRETGEQDGITTPLELYSNSSGNVFVIQQRSPVIKSRKAEFVNSLISFAQQFSAVLVLTGVDLSDRQDAHMSATTYSLILRSLDSDSDKPTPIVTLGVNVPPFVTHSPADQSLSGIPVIPGSGITRRFITSLPESFPPTGVILEYVLEGDNRSDAKILAGTVAKVLLRELGISSDDEWKEPPSWKQGLFGSSHDQSLFG
ncbi:hypothetical protein FRC02_012438 [Tulasnella sp. 418]|nr:hypothetical protein FRC02_012438 [Tulasnella sp. 418]